MSDIAVLLVDDQDLVRAGFRTILESEPGVRVVGEARDGAEAVRLAAELRPDVVCMDVQMPIMDGLEATERIAAAGSAGGVLMLTTFNREDYLLAAIRAGASGFLLKNASAEELVHAVQVLAAGDALLDTEVTRTVLAELRDGRRPTVGATPELATLTAREREVLEHVACGASNGEIAKALFLGEATVKTHVSNLLLKLGLRDRIQAVVYAYEHGVVTPGG